ncbi:MAG TPA: hypothetical protein VMZ31_13575 [Phycisphaerae bacterium]|nr:hypothetical protein [Phycisphaerae bacterium]
MRWRLVLTGLLALPALTCVQPPERLTPETEPFDLRISVSRPAEDVVFSDAEPVEIRWSDLGPYDLDGDGRLNDPPDGSTVMIQLDPDPNDPDSGNEIDVLGPFDAVPDDDLYEFDGLDADGEIVEAGVYYVLATMDTGDETLTDASLGTIRVPLAFSEPETDVELNIVDDSTTIAWTADDGGIAGGTVDFGLDPDPVDHTDEGEGEDEDEKYFLKGQPLTDGDFTLSGAVIGSAGIADGTYYLFARIEQPGFDTMYITSPVQITIGAFGPPTLEFVDLDNDVEKIVGDIVIIKWEDDDADDNAKIDLFVVDDVTGDEVQLLNDRLEDADGSQDRYNWNTTGMRPAAYRVKATISDDTSTVEVVADGKIILRSCTDCPLITITSPAADVDGMVMNRIRIRWQDDTPVAGAKVALYYDDDPNPMEAAETGDPEVRITPVDGLPGNLDGTDADSFEWVLRPDDLAQPAVPGGTYWIFGYIGKAQVPVPPSISTHGYSVAAGKVTVDDSPPELEFIGLAGDVDAIVGDTIIIEWEDRDPDDNAKIDLFVVDGVTGVEEQLLNDRLEDADGLQDEFDWDTTGMRPAVYRVKAIISDDTSTVEVVANGKIILRSCADCPLITITSPSGDIDATAVDKIEITWQDDTPAAGAKVALYYDDDPNPMEAADPNETRITLASGLPGNPDGTDYDDFEWDLRPEDLTEPAVPAGEYWIFGYIGKSDVPEPPSTDIDGYSVAAGKVTVGNTPPQLEFTTPGDTDETLIIDDPNDPNSTDLTIKWNSRDADDPITIELFIDLDGNHDNGNERPINTATINADVGPESDEEEWNNPSDGVVDASGAAVPPGEYTLFALVDDGINDPVVVEAEGKIIIQSGPGSQPQITMVEPLVDVSPTVGSPILLSWQDDNTVAGTKIQLRYDDDPIPDQGTETGDNEVNIDALRDANPDGSADQFSWSWHPDPSVNPANILLPAVPEGEYYVFGYIGGADPVNSPSSIDVAAGRILVPNTSPELVFTTPPSGQNLNVPLGAGAVFGFNFRDAEDDVRVKLFLDPDTNHSNGNEVRIDKGNTTLDFDPNDPRGHAYTQNWDGTNFSGQTVETGTYFLYAKLNDDTNPEVTVEAGASRKVNVIGVTALASGTGADVANTGGSGPFTLIDGGADFVGAGVTEGDRVKITGGTGANVGVYSVTAIAANMLTLDEDAGDSGGAGNVVYQVFEKDPPTAAVIVMATPASNQQVSEGDDVSITWADLTATGSETITLVYSTSSTADAGAEVGAAETLIRSGIQAALDGVNDQATWDTSGMAAGTYYIHGKILAGATVKDTSTAKGSVEITGAAITPSLAFSEPAIEKDVVVGGPGVGDNDPPLGIIWQYESGATGNISLFIDRDTINTNGTERLILSNRKQPAAPAGATDSFPPAGVWKLTDLDGVDVPTGKYFMRGVLNVSGSSPVYATAPGRVNIRKTVDSPLILLTAPAADISITTAQSRQVAINWNADDPGGNAEVHLWYSTTANADNDTPRILETATGGPITRLGDVKNASGFELVDRRATFEGIVDPNDQVRVVSGTGAVVGTYTVTEVERTVLTLDADPGDSGDSGDVAYVVADEVLATGSSADVSNAAGLGPFTLTDPAAAFAGVVDPNDQVRVVGGTGTVVGTYTVTLVADQELTLSANAGDSGLAGDVVYVVGHEVLASSGRVAASEGTFTWFINPGDLAVGTYYIHAVIGSGARYINDEDRDTTLGQLTVRAP